MTTTNLDCLLLCLTRTKCDHDTK